MVRNKHSLFFTNGDKLLLLLEDNPVDIEKYEIKEITKTQYLDYSKNIPEVIDPTAININKPRGSIAICDILGNNTQMYFVEGVDVFNRIYLNCYIMWIEGEVKNTAFGSSTCPNQLQFNRLKGQTIALKRAIEDVLSKVGETNKNQISKSFWGIYHKNIF